MSSTDEQVAAVLHRHGQTFAEQAGITLANKPSPLYRLLVLSLLLSARISADIAVAAARELSASGYRTPQAMLDASWQDRVDALGRGHYRRYDERTATMLGDGAQLLVDRYGGDLRRLHDGADGVPGLERKLQEFPGIGPTGAAIFCREVQGVWPDVAPYVDKRALQGAEKAGLPTSADELAALVSTADLPRLMAACVRAARA
ncbi:endonuclease [Actinobacteria bacterium YIM 96077]|uniref:Endonuclease n=1 Tax=Phytoactinopolyspora halophila TaxID=1981511 RepID=A0A329R0P2_9ACTN|nr:endonuclease [Phytoactinopolyspora halophila]AYY12718.1 endonuclease [Actinobacteria bacterium YIM 96077]RAW16488.1 endonuclease [Phytoactinopolyspora halophila]